ncbi:MAG: cyclic nucleotide-binding domain-containing protein [Bacteroidota bacterium]
MYHLLFEYIDQHITLSEEEKAAIVALDVFRSVKKRTVLLEQGQRSKETLFVLKGCLRTYYMIDGEEKTTAFYTEMEGLTPHCVASGQPSEYYIAAVEDCLLTVSEPDMDQDMFARFPKFETLCRIISEKLLAKQQIDFDAFRTSSPEQRYLNLLHNRPDLIQRVPQHQLASYLGVAPQSLSRMKARIHEKERA